MISTVTTTKSITVTTPTIEKELKEFGTKPLPQNAGVPLSSSMSDLKTYKLYVGGKQVRAESQASRSVLNSKGDVHCLVADASRKDVRNAVEAARSAQAGWWKRSRFNRAQILHFFAENFETRASQFVQSLQDLCGGSSGMTKSLAEEEVRLCSEAIFHWACQCDKMQMVGRLHEPTECQDTLGVMAEHLEPIGVVAIVCDSPHNIPHPLLSVVLHCVAAIACGNSVICVADERVPSLALDLHEVLDTSDVPGGVINLLSGDKRVLTKAVCEHQEIQAVWYMTDVAKDVQGSRFVKHASQFNLKKTWLIDNTTAPTTSGSKEASEIDSSYYKELKWRSLQSKYVSMPMGTIFAN